MAAIMQKYTPEPCREWIASMLRGAGDANLPASEDAVVAAAMDQGVAALLLAAIAAEPVVTRSALAELIPRLAAWVRDQIAVEMLRKAETTRVTTALVEGGFPFLVLKGAALAYRVFSEPHQRPRIDLDLLMPDIDVVEAARPLMESLGYERSKRPNADTLMANETPFRRKAPGGTVHWIDAHWALTNNALFGTRFSYEELSRQSVPVPGLGPQVRGLDDVHALIHACLHRVANLPFGVGDRLIWLYDILLLAKRLSPQEWEQMADLATERGVAGPVLGGLEAAGEWLACPHPEPVAQRLRQAAAGERFDMRKAHLRGHQEWHNFLAIPIRLRPRWVWQKLFPSEAYIESWRTDGGRVTIAVYFRRLLNVTRLFR